MRYDVESNIISWEIAKGAISHAYEFGDLIVHVSRVGKPILIEILDAGKFIGKMGVVKLPKKLGQIVPAGMN